jgi:16S rRNA G1207 methylase RsmC
LNFLKLKSNLEVEVEALEVAKKPKRKECKKTMSLYLIDLPNSMSSENYDMIVTNPRNIDMNNQNM